MKISTPVAKPKTSGSTLIDDLYVNDKGQVEPVFVLRASEPAAAQAILEYLRTCQALGYDQQVVEQQRQNLVSVQRWQAENGGTLPRRLDTTVVEQVLAPTPVLAKGARRG